MRLVGVFAGFVCLGPPRGVGTVALSVTYFILAAVL